jgi:hypothetical protein
MTQWARGNGDFGDYGGTINTEARRPGEDTETSRISVAAVTLTSQLFFEQSPRLRASVLITAPRSPTLSFRIRDLLAPLLFQMFLQGLVGKLRFTLRLELCARVLLAGLVRLFVTELVVARQARG